MRVKRASVMSSRIKKSQNDTNTHRIQTKDRKGSSRIER